MVLQIIINNNYNKTTNKLTELQINGDLQQLR